VWETTVNGRALHFRLFGINNQNFIMRDDETGSWWQQVSGEAIRGPLKGTKLRPVPQDEIAFAIWKREQPRGRVLRPDPSVRQYAKADWETRMQTTPVATRTDDRRLAPRELVVGVTINGKSKAYPMRLLDPQSPLMDSVGGVPIAIVVAEDKRSVRAFSRRLDDGTVIELFGRADVLLDSRSGSQWDFTGTAVRGPWAGRQLEKIEVLRDYWFDWRTYNPGTAIYRAGL
jgi:Protein of unknown function (DUF3179)